MESMAENLPVLPTHGETKKEELWCEDAQTDYTHPENQCTFREAKH
jgi:hypothetical protein